MDSKEFIEIQRLPFAQRLDMVYRHVEDLCREGAVIGREGDAPLGTSMVYRDYGNPEPARKLIFGSNGYLGLATDPYVISKVQAAVALYGIGTGGSPAFSGYTAEHRKLEARLASLAGHEDAVLLPGGYLANLCWVNGLMTRSDILLYDKHSHASVINAIKMTGVRFFSFDPENLEAYADLVGKIRVKYGAETQIFSTIEGIRSVDGMIADIGKYLEICERHGIVTILDDAHGLGTVGRTGKGTLEHLGLMGRFDLRMSTCSKAMGAQGAFVSGSKKAIFYLRNYSKPYVFTTALSHPILAAISAGLDLLEADTRRVDALRANTRYMQDGLEAAGFRILRSPGGIIPVFLPDGQAAKFNRAIDSKGLFANVMAYPMVPPGMERIRLSIMANHTREELDQALDILTMTALEFGILKGEEAGGKEEAEAEPTCLADTGEWA
jgi:glycine C-acetyltransferase